MQTDEKTFREMIHRQRDMIWQLCRSYRLAAAWEPDDAFQEVLCSLWQGMSGYEGRSSERTWVYRVTVNTLTSLIRRQGNQPAPPMPEEVELCYDDQNYHDLVELIETLSEPDYTIVRAHAEGYSYHEISQMTSLTVGAVSMRLTRALRKLRKQYRQLQ